MKSNLKAMEATLYAMITPSTNAYNNVQKLNGLQFDDKVETARVEALKNLELEVNKVTDKIKPMIEDVNKKGTRCNQNINYKYTLVFQCNFSSCFIN